MTRNRKQQKEQEKLEETTTEGPVTTARELIRAGNLDQGIQLLTDKLGDLCEADRRRAHNLLGLGFFFGGRFPEAFSWFTIAAQGSEVPEDWYNVALSQLKMGDPQGALTTWQRVFDLSYRHQDAPETCSFFQKKYFFAEALKDAGVFDERGFELLQQLVPFYLTNHITDPSFWGIRGVPSYYDVLRLMLEYYRGLDKSRAEWEEFCDRIVRSVDTEGGEFAEELKAQWPQGNPT